MAPRGTFCGRLKYHNRYVARDIGQASAWHLAARDTIHTKATLQLRAAAAMATARRRSGRGEEHRGIMIQFRTQKKANLCLHGNVHPGYLKASRAQEAFGVRSIAQLQIQASIRSTLSSCFLPLIIVVFETGIGSAASPAQERAAFLSASRIPMLQSTSSQRWIEFNLPGAWVLYLCLSDLSVQFHSGA